MSSLERFIWLGIHAFRAGPVLFPLPSLIAAAGLVVAVIGAFRNPEFGRPRCLWLLLPAVLPVLILLHGVFFAYQGPMGAAPAWPVTVIESLILAHLPLAAVMLWRLNGIRLVAAGTGAALLWYSWCAGFVAIMYVTNVWL